MYQAKVLVFAVIIALGASAAVEAAAPDNGASQSRFGYLSRHGNSSCAPSFLNLIPAMPAGARLQGSCCSPMVLQRYRQQLEGLKKYADLPEIPPDPYDIEAGLARRMLAAYDMKLDGKEQAAYDFAMRHSAEKGPCCCQCWRWHAYGGLAKLLIRNHGFTGPQVTQIWNLSDGCGGTA